MLVLPCVLSLSTFFQGEYLLLEALVQVGTVGLVWGSQSLCKVLKHLWRGSRSLSLDRKQFC